VGDILDGIVPDLIETETDDARPPSRMAVLAIVVTCLVLGATSGLESHHVSVVHGFPLGWGTALGSTMPRWLYLAATLPFVLWVALAVPPLPLRGRVFAVHVPLFLLIAAGQAAVSAWSVGVAAPHVAEFFTWAARITRSFYESMPLMVGAYGAVLFAAWGMLEAKERERRTIRASQLEAQLHAARLASLRAQLQPHFLYNTLNAISALVSDLKPQRAVAAIEQLGELLHASLRDDSRQEISVEEEVALAERYLALQGMRFGERLRYELTVAPAVSGYLVPVLLLQPIVENAVVHGLDAGSETLKVSIAAIETARGVELRVENDGPTASTNGARAGGSGVGLALTRARIETAYGKDGSLELLPREGGGTVVRFLLPRAPRRDAASSGDPATAGDQASGEATE
jgi:two-component system LytT family sensor kinase